MGNEMAQFVSEQALIVVQLRGEAESPERPFAFSKQVSDTLANEHPDQMVVQTPPCSVMARDSNLDEGYVLVDHHSDQSERAAARIARDYCCRLWVREDGFPDIHKPRKVVGLTPSVGQHFPNSGEGRARILALLAPHSVKRGTAKVGT